MSDTDYAPIPDAPVEAPASFSSDESGLRAAASALNDQREREQLIERAYTWTDAGDESGEHAGKPIPPTRPVDARRAATCLALALFDLRSLPPVEAAMRTVLPPADVS
jgi:hypothetical protein